MPVNVGPIEDAISSLDRDMKSPIPTPPVGTMVIWYDRAEVRPGAEIAAMVTAVESPGKLKLVAFRPQGMPEHKRGVLHISDPIHENRHNAVSRHAGGWSYPHGVSVPKDHYQPHLEVLKARKDSLVKSLNEAKEVSANEQKVG